MNNNGFTLLELLITLVIITLLVTIGGPSFSTQVQRAKTETTTLSLLEAIELTRTQAVAANTRTTMKARNSWENGWDIFLDSNENGLREEDEKLLASNQGIERVSIRANQPVKAYISYIGSGESRLQSSAHRGAFQAGTLSICPEGSGSGYQLILSRGGRVRMQEIDARRCSELRP